MDSIYMESFGDEYSIRVPKQLSGYTMQEVIGKGGTSVVIKAYDNKNKRIVACKLVDRSMFDDKIAFLQFEREIRLFARLNHPSIAKLYDIIYLPDIIVLVMEYCANGTILSNVLEENFFSKFEVLRISKELLEGINYIHQNGITHRDIKPDNIGLDEEFHPKLLDFGLSRESSNKPTTTKCGSPYYLAPEVLTNKSYDPKMVDIWSFGVTVHVLATGLLPWCVEEDQFLHKMYKGEVEPALKCEGDVLKIVSMCLTPDPKKRRTAAQILTSDAFNFLNDSLSLKTHQHPRMASSFTKKPILQNTGHALSRKRFIVRKGPVGSSTSSLNSLLTNPNASSVFARQKSRFLSKPTTSSVIKA